MSTNPVKTRVEGGILEVIIDRPKANAIDRATSRIMGEVFANFRDDNDLRVAILSGAGEKFFSAGWDLKAAAGGEAVDGDYGIGGFGGIQELEDIDNALDHAVLDSYTWPHNLSDEEILEHLLALNLERAAAHP